MAESERRPLPSLLLLIMALFGLASIQGLTGTAPKPESPGETKGEEKTGAGPRRGDGGAAEETDDRILGPLLDYYRTAANGKVSRAAALERSRVDGLRILIATVPDPVRTTNSHRFDEWIGAIQRACESEGYVLAGFRLPGGAGDHPANTPSAPATGKAAGPQPATAPQPATTPQPAAEAPDHDPGVLLFRGEKTTSGVVPLLAALLVPETPTLGLDKVALTRSLDLAAIWDRHNHRWGGAESFHILGPSFSGSQTSLEQALVDWTSRADRGRCAVLKVAMGAAMSSGLRLGEFRIISGSASAVRVDGLEGCVGWPRSVRFSATVHQSRTLLRTMLRDLGESSARVAMLVEANTEFGRGIRKGPGPAGSPEPTPAKAGAGPSTRPRLATADQEPVYYPFPLHISKIRGYYQKQGLLRDQASATLRSFERLTIPFEEAGDATDIPPMQTPGFTTAVDELVLGQILADITRRDIHTVGITATDPLDTIFLARQIRQFLPDVRLFATQSYLLYTHPQNVDDLRGMLVASTYPLFSPNQSWSYSYRGDVTHVFFSSEPIQGTYNAAIAHLEILGNRDIPARFLEYGTPFEPPGSYSPDSGAARSIWGAKPRRPPVWIGMVGNHGLYPLRTVARPIEEDPDYLYVHEQSEDEYSGMLGLPRPSEAEGQAAAWRRIRDWFRPEFPALWLYLFLGASLAALAAAGVGLLVCRWTTAGLDSRDCAAFRLGRFPMDGLARSLDCCRADDAARQAECRGPGPFLPIGLAFLFVVYVAISAPLLEVVARVPWIPMDPRQFAPLWAGLLAYAVSWLLAITWVLSLFARRPAGGPGPPGGGATRLARSRRPLAILIGLVILGPPVALFVSGAFQSATAYAFADVDAAGRDALIRLTRWMAIPSGVSPFLPMLFIGVAGLAWVYTQLRRRFLSRQFTPGVPPAAPRAAGGTLAGDAITLRSIREERALIDDVLESPTWPFRSDRLIWSIAVAAYFVLFLTLFVGPVVGRLRPSRWDAGALGDIIAGWLILAIFGLLGFHALQLVILWRHVRRVMGLVLRLPLASALDRIPSRVAAWLKEPPRSGDGRFELIRRQALALAEAGEADDGAVRREDPILAERFDSYRWWVLNQDLKALGPRNIDDVIARLRDYLLSHWKAIPVEAVFHDAAEGKAGPSPGASERLGAWVGLAEDLLAMSFLRWLAAALAQVWTLIGFLVAGSVALLFAISSYPFPFQERMLVGMGLLIAVLVFMILAIVMGFNRDEMVSRLSNTAPNRLKLNQDLLGHLLAYIVPLVGALAALSSDASDTLRALFDPILRYLR